MATNQQQNNWTQRQLFNADSLVLRSADGFNLTVNAQPVLGGDLTIYLPEGGGGGGNPGGPNDAVQFHAPGNTFGGSNNFTYNGTEVRLTATLFRMRHAAGVFMQFETATGADLAEFRIFSSNSGVDGTIGLGLGAAALCTVDTRNLAIGQRALTANTTGTENVALGTDALRDNVLGSENVAVGFEALAPSDGVRNVAVGALALASNTSGGDNTALGYLALGDNTTGTRNVSIGAFSRQGAQVGIDNVAVGFQAARSVLGGDQNTAVGASAMSATGVADPVGNTAVGFASMTEVSSGAYNSALGWLALELNTTGDYNVALGSEAMKTNISGSYNIGIGVQSGAVNRTGTIAIGVGATVSNDFQAAIGSVGNPIRLGINMVNPSARLHLPAGDGGGGNAPLKLTPGPLTTVPEDGAMEYDGTDLWFTVGATRKKVTLV